MKKYIIKRVIAMIITLFVVSSITFILMHVIPGGPFVREKPLPEQVLHALNEKYNLNDPMYKQYIDYMKGLLTFDMGPSFSRLGVQVNELIMDGFPVSAKLGGVVSLVVIVFGIPLGIISALKQNSAIDYGVMTIATLGITIPNFVIGTVIIYIFAGKLGWLPSHGFSTPLHYIGPVIALGGYSLSFVARLTRSSMLEVIQQDYIRTARANGLSPFKIISKHALKNVLIPVITYIGPMIASIMTGSFVVEKIFAIPGMGEYFITSVSNRDYTVIMGMTVFYAAFSIIMIFAVDIAYALLDPRIKYQK